MNAPDLLQPAPHGPVAFGDFVLDMAQARLQRGGVALPLNGRPLQVLALLAAHPGRLIGKDEVLDAVWGHRHVTESVLKGAVNVLREALGDDARAPRYVETVPRRGYRFVAEVAPLAAPLAATAAWPRTPAVQPVPAASSTSGQPAAPPAARPGNLPAQMDALIGRQAELDQLLALMAGHRLVTLTGLGGVGKTRLALAAAGAAPALPDGVWLLRLDDLDDAAQLPTMLAGSLQLGSTAAAGVPALVRALAGQRLRLVLDNAEHLVGAVAELAAAVLAGAPGVRLLVTSQLPLRLGAERVLPLAPLALPADWADSAPLPQAYPAAQLLCTRIAQQRAGWQPSPADHADLAAICRALDGVPLALELAAARVPLLGVAGVRARLDERFALLTRGARDAATRHRTLAAALDWTFALLQPHERDALQRLAVFAGSFSVVDAEGVLQGLWQAEPLDVIDELQARSLLAPADGPAGDAPRFRLFDSVRRHALAGLGTAGQDADARRRLLAWLCQRSADLHRRELFEPKAQWLPPCQADVDSLRTALRHGLDDAAPPADAALGVMLLVHSLPFWYTSGRRAEGQGWMQRALRWAARPELPLDDWQRTLLDHGQGVWCANAQQGDPVAALAALRAARPGLQQAGDRQRLYLSHYLEIQLMLRVEADLPRRPVVAALQAALDPAWPPLAARFALVALAVQCRDDGDMAGYLQHSQRMRALAEQAGGRIECWVADNPIGQALALLGRSDEACEHFARAVDDVRAAGALRSQVPLVAMGAALALRRRLDHDSRARALEALRLLAAEGMVWWMADALPWAAWHDGRPADAARLQAWADALVAQRGDRRGPIFGGLREAMVAVLGEAATAVDVSSLPGNDAQAVDLALGPGASAAMLPVALPG